MATAIVWIRANAGTWTRIFQGPSFHVGGFQLLEFRAPSPGQASFLVAFTLDRYSAVLPFYFRETGTLTAVAQSGYRPLGTTRIVPALSSSPWTEIWINPAATCEAHILV